jgi:signal transduction histidine kinase
MNSMPGATPAKSDPAPVLPSGSALVIDRAPLPTIEVEGAGHVVSHVSFAFCRLAGKTRAELLGKPFAEIVPGGDDCMPVLDSVFQTGNASTHVQPGDSRPNGSRWLYAMWPALDEQERPVGVIIQLTTDAKFQQNAALINEALLISGLRQHELTTASQNLNGQLELEIIERKLAELALREAKDRLIGQAAGLESLVSERTEKLRETIGELEAFSYSIAHDMRSPLRTMSGFSQMLLQEYTGKLDAKAIDYLERISRSAMRLDRLIQDVLNYTKILRGEVVLEKVNLDWLVRDLISAYPKWQSPAVEIEIEGALPTVSGNEAFLTQCLSNLIGNAVKFVSPGKIPRIKIWAEAKNDFVRLWIGDNGIGIASADRERVFKMFERIHLATEYEGTGIGLTIARRAVERMGGTIGFDSEPEKGTRFWIELKKI